MEGASSLDELSAQFGVSTATIRRDIKYLERDRKVVQTVGGGVLYGTASNGAAASRQTDDVSIERKIRIAEFCTDLVREGDEIIVAPGSTATIVGRILTGVTDRRFRLITCSLDLALDAAAVPNIETVILGGDIVGRYSTGFSGRDDYFSTAHRGHKLILSAKRRRPCTGPHRLRFGSSTAPAQDDRCFGNGRGCRRFAQDRPRVYEYAL